MIIKTDFELKLDDKDNDNNDTSKDTRSVPSLINTRLKKKEMRYKDYILVVCMFSLYVCLLFVLRRQRQESK
jgi:hypothetical protein